MINDPDVRVSNVRFDRVTMGEAVAIVTAFALQHVHPRYVCTGNVDHLRLAAQDEEFARAYEEADLVLADGMPVVWLSRLAGSPLPERVAGSDLTRRIGRISSETNCKVFLLGGQPGSAARTGDRMMLENPGANIVGSYCPPIELFDSPEEQAKILRTVREAQPDVLLVAFGAPKQEKWIRKNLLELNVPVTLGVGGSFEMIAGIRSRAPLVVQKMGLEWLWRFSQEPVRLFRRYFLDGIPFLTKTAFIMAISRLISEDSTRQND
jgi:N-acetylglucosaminyldiphosphoundecaprenol N-acetyl-beta-D-mannosaminyltransferase